MRKTNSPGISLNAVLKSIGAVLKSLFQSSDNRDFKRLKDFISS